MSSKRESSPPPDGLSIAELARRNHVPESTLRDRLKRCGTLESALREKHHNHAAAGRMGAAHSPWRGQRD